MPQPSLRELESLVGRGELKFVYVFGVPRANTTVLCRLLGRRLHGAVYEPALPNSAFPGAAYPRKILSAYRAVRANLPHGEPVTLAIKDMSALMGPAERDFALEHAAHAVFAIREPALQHSSYSRQMLAEFTARNRVRAFAITPWESLMYGVHFSRRWPRYRRLARERLGLGWSAFRRMTASGANLEFWDALAAHFAEANRRLPIERISVIDAGLSRLLPEAAEAELDAIVAPIAPAQRLVAPLDFAGHTLMKTESAWAAEAMQAERLLGIGPQKAVRSPYPDFDAFLPRMAGALYPAYLELFYHPAHRLRRHVISQGAPRPGDADALMGHLLEARDPAGALALARDRGRIAA